MHLHMPGGIEVGTVPILYKCLCKYQCRCLYTYLRTIYTHGCHTSVRVPVHIFVCTSVHTSMHTPVNMPGHMCSCISSRMSGQIPSHMSSRVFMFIPNSPARLRHLRRPDQMQGRLRDLHALSRHVEMRGAGKTGCAARKQPTARVMLWPTQWGFQLNRYM